VYEYAIILFLIYTEGITVAFSELVRFNNRNITWIPTATPYQ